MENPRLQRILDKVSPKTFFEDLAEYGFLMQYVNEFAPDQFQNDDDFKMKIYNVLYKHSKYPDQGFNHYYLWHLNNSMNQFFEKVENA